MKRLRSTAILLVVATVLITVAFAVLVTFDASFLRPTVTRQATAAFERPVQVEGDLELALWPAPRVLVRDVRIGNPPWTVGEHLALVEEFSLRMDLGSLLRGEFYVAEATARGVDLVLEERADGTDNYTFGGSDDPSPLPSVDRLRVKDVSVVHRSVAGTLRRFHIDEGRLWNAPGEQPGLEVSGSARGLPTVLRIDGPPPAPGMHGVRDWRVRGRGDGDGIVVDLDARIADLTAWDSARYAIAVQADSAARMNRLLDLNLPDHGPLNLEGVFLAEDPHYRLEDVHGRVEGLPGLPPLDLASAHLRFGGEAPTEAGIQGTLEGVPVSFSLAGGPLGQAGTPDVAWPARVALSIEDGHLRFEGDATARDGGAALEGALDVSVRAPADGLSTLTGVTLPSRGWLKLSGQLQGQGDRWVLDALEGSLEDTGATAPLAISGGRIETGPESPLTLEVTGSLAKAPVKITLTAAPVETSPGGLESWPVTARASRGNASVTARGQFAHPVPAGSPRFIFQVEAAGKTLREFEPFSGMRLPALGPYRLSGRLQATAATLSLSGLSGRLGKSDVAGTARLEFSERRSRLRAELTSRQIALEPTAGAGTRGGRKATAEPAWRALPVPTKWMETLDLELEWSVARLSGLATELESVSMRAVSNGGTLTVDPLRATISGVPVEGTAALRAARSPEVTVSAIAEVVDLGALLERHGVSAAPPGRLEQVNMRVSGNGPTLGRLADGLKLAATATSPAIELPSVTGDESRLLVQDVRVDLSRSAEPGAPAQIEARGRVDSMPLDVKGSVPSLSTLLSTPAPWPLDLDLTLGSTRVRAEGRAGPIANPTTVDIRFELSGSDLAELAPTLNLAIPLVGPYVLKGHVSETEAGYRFDELDLRVGRSDIGGRVEAITTGERTRWEGDFSSENVYLTDLELVPRDDPAPSPVSEDRLIPDFTLPRTLLREANVGLRYRVANLRSAHTRMGEVELTAHVRDGRFVGEKLRVRGSQRGELSASWETDVNADPAMNRLRIKGTDLDYTHLIDKKRMAGPAEGDLSVDVNLEGPGNTRREFLAAADGRITVVGGPARISSRFFELWAAGLFTTMLSPEWHKEKNTQLNCFVADVSVKDGIASSDDMIIDTRRITIAGSGVLNLESEALDLLLAPRPKKASLVSFAQPVHVRGTLSRPKFSVAKLPGRRTLLAGTSMLMGLVNPAFLVFAFADVGTGEKNSCLSAIEEAHRREKTPSG